MLVQIRMSISRSNHLQVTAQLVEIKLTLSSPGIDMSTPMKVGNFSMPIGRYGKVLEIEHK